MVKRFVIVIFFGLCSCHKNEVQLAKPQGIDFREEMRQFVMNLSAYAKSKQAAFVIIPQNGQELISTNGEASGPLHSGYLQAIDGQGCEDLFFGYNQDNQATPGKDSQYMLDFLRVEKQQGKVVLVTDYCSDLPKIDTAHNKNAREGFLSFVAESRELDQLPSANNLTPNTNAFSVTKLGEARNFLYLINPDKYASKTELIKALSETSFDVMLIDAFYADSILNVSDIQQLQHKSAGGRRLVISYLSIGEAENYRFYWQNNWKAGNPTWLYAENPDWPGNYKVAYWEKGWQDIIFGNENAYLDKVLNAGFDGAYLDIIDAYEYFESL